MNLNDFRKKIPQLEGLDDEAALNLLHEVYYPDADKARMATALGVKITKPEPVRPQNTLMGFIGDRGLDLVKGAVAVPEAAVGVADLVTGGAAGRAAEEIGFRPREAKEMLSGMQSDAYRDRQAQFQAADGIVAKTGVALTNPSLIAGAVTESLPLMAAGGAVGRGVMAAAPKLASPVVAGALGEGAVAAGSIAEQVRQQTADGYLTPKQAVLSAAAGVGTAAFGYAGAKAAKAMGIADLDTALVRGSMQATRDSQIGVIKRVAGGMFSESMLEELPQSVVEQMAQNIALDKPVMQDVDSAIVMGALSSAAMGGSAALLSRPKTPTEDAADTIRTNKVPEAGTLSKAVNTGIEASAKAVEATAPAPSLTNFDPATMIPENPLLAGARVRENDSRQEAMTDQAMAKLERMNANDMAVINSARFDQSRGANEISPTEVVEPAQAGDILNPAGEPFKTRMAADRAAKKTPGAVVPVEGGFIVRPQESVNVQDVLQAPEVSQAAPVVSPPGQATQAVGAQPAGPTAGVPTEGSGAVEATGVSGEFADLFDEQGRPKFSNAQSVKDFKKRTGLGQDGVRAIQVSIQEGRPITVDEARQVDLAGQERRKAGLEQSKADSEADAQAAKQNSANPTEPSKVLGDYEIPGLEGGTNRVRVIQRGGRIEAISLEEGTVSNDLSRLIQSGQTVEQALAALYGDHGPNEAPNPSRVKRVGQPTSAAAPAAAAGLTDGAPAVSQPAQAQEVVGTQPAGSQDAGPAQASRSAEDQADQQGLTSYTPQEIEDRLSKLEQAEKERQQQEREAEQRAKADAERDDFTLTGSDRTADVAAARGRTDIFSAPSEEQVSTKTSEKTGNTTKTYGGYVDGDGVPVELSIVRRADGTLFRVFAKYGDGTRNEFDASYGPGITDEQIVKAVAEPSDWEKVAAKSTADQASEKSKGDRFPSVESITGLRVGPGGTIKPKAIAPGKPLYRETDLEGLNDILRSDSQADVVGLFVSDNPDLAIGQGNNTGVQIVFRPDSLSGKEHVKPMTGELAGREYKTDVVAPRAVQEITMRASDLKSLRPAAKRALSDFDRSDLPGGLVRFTRKGLSNASQPQAPKLTPAEAKSLMAWEDLGQKDGVKTHALTFYESQRKQADGFENLLSLKSTKLILDDGRGRKLYDVQVTPAFRNRHFVNGRMPVVNGLELKHKADVTGVPSDNGWVLIDNREQLASRNVPKNQANPNTSAEPAQKTAKSEQVEPFEHAGLKIRPSRVKEGDQVVDRWVVQSPENAEREARGERQIGGDSLHDTIEQAKAAAEREAKRDAEQQAAKAEQDAADKARLDAEEARKAANRPKSVVERRKDAILDGPSKIGQGTKRAVITAAVDNGYAIEAKMVYDHAAKKRDQEAVDRASRAGYILGVSNENLPLVKAGNEAKARLKEGKYEKPEYRVYQGSDTTAPFREITKTEYDYAQELKAQRAAAQQAEAAPAAATQQAADDFLPEGWTKSVNGFTKRPVYRMEQGVGQPFAVVTQTEGMTYEVQIRHGDKQLTTGTQRGALSEVLAAAEAELGRMKQADSVTHADPGEKAEAATPAVVTDSLKKAARNEDTKPSEMRKWLVAEIDKELLQAPDRADYDEAVKRLGEKDAISGYTGNGPLGKNNETGYVTFDVPGDGKYKVRNSVRGLLEFRKNVMASQGFKDSGQKRAKPEQNDGVQGGSGGSMTAIANMIEEGDFEAARDYAEAVGIKLEDVKVPRGDMKPAWEKYLKDGTLPPAAWMPSKEWQFQDFGASSFVPDSEKKSAILIRVADGSTYVATVKGSLDNTGAKYTVTKDGKEIGRSTTRAPFSETLRMAEDAMPEANDKPAPSKASDTGWNMAGTGYGGKRYRGRNITLDDGREVVARIYENAGNYDEVEVKVDGARKFTARDSFNAQDKADAFIRTLTTTSEMKVVDKLATPDKMTPRQFDDWIRQRASIQTEQFRGDRNHGGGDEGVGYIHLSGKIEEGGTNWAGAARGAQDKRDTRLIFRTDDNKIVWYDDASQQVYEVPKDDARLEITRPEPTPKQARDPHEITVTVDGADYTVTFDEPLATISNQAFQDNLDEYGTPGVAKAEFRKLRAQAQAGGASESAATGARRDPTQVSMFNPYNDGDIVTIDGQDWTVKADTPGWYLTNTGNWRGTHPTIRNIKAMADLIREVEQASVAQKAAEIEPEAHKLTPAEAKSLMAWEDLGQKDGVKTHALTFYESQADKDAKRGRMIVAKVSKGDRSATAWMVDGEDKTFGMLAQAKKLAEEVGMAKAVADGFVEPAAAPASLQEGIAQAQANAARFEIGKSLTKEQRKQVLATLTDVYKTKRAERELKGVGRDGNERYGYVHSPELFEKSDITGAMVRYYVTLPDGKIAHPTELFPDYTQSDIDSELERRATQAKNMRDTVRRQYAPEAQQFNSVVEAGRFWDEKSDESLRKHGQWRTILPSLERTTLSNGEKFIMVPDATMNDQAMVEAFADEGWTPWKASAAEPTKPAAPIEDAGEKIGGARKDRWKERGLNLDDLDAMTEAEGAELATKANVWKPDYEALAAQSEPVTAAMVKTIYDQLAAKPKQNTPEGRRQYVQMMRIVRDVLTEAKGPEAVKNAYLEIRKRAGLNAADPAAKATGRELLFSVYKGRSDPFVLGYTEMSKAKKLVEDGFPAKGEPWKTRLSVGRAEGGPGTTERGIEIYVERSAEVGTPLTREQILGGFYRVTTKDNKTVAFAASKADAEAAAATVYERDMKGKKDGKPEPVRPNLDELKRENLPQRIDRDVTSEDFVRDLGFRGVEFGNWSAQDERQRILNMAYDGLMDLAEIMGVPPKAMSLNGTLGMAFGARGGGRFAAHYEPGKLVINMTKIRGGGSMAHEWAHAMDHYFGELDKSDAYTTQARGASGWYSEDQYNGVPRKRMERVGNEWKNVEKMRLDNLRPEMAAAFDEVMRALFQKQITKAEMVRSHELDLERTQALARSEQDAEMKAMYQNMVQNKREALNELRNDPEGKLYAGRGRSDYAQQAQALSGKSVDGYWVRPTEMFARAFESWVFDKVTAMGARSDYLVHGVEEDRFAGGGYKGNPYPTGEERARINAAFDKLASTIKTKQTDKGVAMFSRATATQAAIGTPAATIRAAIAKAYGKLLGQLESKGLVTLTQTEDEAIEAAAQARAAKTGQSVERERAALRASVKNSVADPDIRRSADGAIQGFFDPQTGQSFLIADNLTAEAAPGVLMHEVGIHMAADGSMKALFNRAAMMIKLQRGNPFMKAVQARMDAAGETSGEEAAAYIAEAYENDRANAPASVQRWLADLLAAVKAWMFKKGIMGAGRLTVADIAAVARANAKTLARGQQGIRAALAFSKAFQPVWYSALQNSIGSLNMKAAPATGWASTIDGLVKAGKVKADEVEWSGVKEWLQLQTGKVTREQVMEYLDANGVKVTETVLGEPDYSEVALWWNDEGGANEELPFDELTAQGKAEAAERYADEVGQYEEGTRQTTKYSQYTLPGATNYREVLLTLPVNERRYKYDAFNPRTQQSRQFETRAEAEAFANEDPSGNTIVSEVEAGKQDYKSSHWDQPNVLAHIRLNDRTDADGKRVLFVEEIQSDWGQTGREKGFATSGTPKIEAKRVGPWNPNDPTGPSKYRMTVDGGDAGYVQGRTEAEAIERLTNERRDFESRVPNAPFVTATDKWLTLALKRVITMAAQEGYDRVAFVNGEQSAERYDLSKEVSALKWETKAMTGHGGRGTLTAIGRHNQEIMRKEMEPSEIEDHIGKEVASRLLDAQLVAEGEGRKAAGVRRLSGIDLKVGGEGMKSFYDKIVPNTLKEVLRKVGGGALELSVLGQQDGSKDINEFLGRWKSASQSLDAVVDNGVIAARKHRQVLQAVVEAIPVNVVDVLAANSISAKDFTRNPKVFFDRLPADARLAVANGLGRALSEVGARIGAGLRAAYKAGLDKEILPTLKASDLSLDEAVGILGSVGGDQLSGVAGNAVSGSPPLSAGAATKTGGLAARRGGGETRAAELADFVGWHRSISPQGSGDDSILIQPAFTITPAMREKVAGGLPLFSRNQSTAVNSAAAIRAVLQKRFGKLIDRLETRGTLKFWDTIEDFNGQASERVEGVAQGLWDGKDAHLFGDGLPVGDEIGVFLHEVGEHASMEQMLGPKRYNDLIERAYALVDAGDKTALAAEARIPEDTPDEDLDSELLAYMIEEVANGATKPQSLSAAARKWLADVLAAIRAWWSQTGFNKMLDRYGQGIELTPQDIAALAVRAVKWKAEQDDGPGGQTARESRAPERVAQTDTPAFKAWFGDSVVTDNGKPMSEGGRPLVVYHGTDSVFTVFSRTGDIGHHFGTEIAARDRAARVGGAEVLVEPVTLSQVEKDSLSSLNGEIGGTPAADLYALLLRKLDSPRQNLRAQVEAMPADEIKKVKAEYLEQPDSLRFAERVDRAKAGEGFRVEVNGETVSTHRTVRGANARAARLRERAATPMALYLRIENPIRLPDLGVWPAQEIAKEAGFSKREMERVVEAGTAEQQYEAVRAILESKGFDGIVYRNEVEHAGEDSYIAFRPEQIKSATGNRGTFDPSNPDIRFSRAADLRKEAAGQVVDLFHTATNVPGRMNWWHKTVGTMYNLAQRSPEFKRVFSAVQDFIDDTAYYADRAARLAPNILPKLETWRDVFKSPMSAVDNRAIRAPIFEGTLTWMRDESGKPVKAEDVRRAAEDLTVDQKAQRLLRNDFVTDSTLRMWRGLPLEQYESIIEGSYERHMLRAGIVFTPAELKSLFKLTDGQVKLYQEFRRATDMSLTNLAISEMVKLGGQDTASMRQAALESEDVVKASAMLRDHLLELADSDAEKSKGYIDAANKIIALSDKAKNLMDKGYAPLSRFGHYTVDVVGPDGTREYFGMFESRFEAAKMAEAMAKNYPDARIERGTVSEQAYKLFAGVTPETIELFGEILGLDTQGDGTQNQAFKAFVQRATANRSAMKRLLERKGIAGFSEDAGRVLAGFVFSNGRRTASNLHGMEMKEAAEAIPKQQGELKDHAVALVEYVQNPQEEAQGLRGLLFTQYIGGSIASAIVNMTQPLTMSLPYLSQFGGITQAGRQMARAVKDVGKTTTGDKALDAAMTAAEEKGIVSPQEVHQLQQQAAGRAALQVGDGTMAGDARAKAGNALSKTMLAWGKLFSAAEQFNRRVTFIAAYRTAVDRGIENPAKFAEDAVIETQGLYNKGNKPKWARGAIGSTLFTFKQYSVAYVEMLGRLAQSGPEGRRAALYALAILFMLSGAGGMPGADDLDDLISGLMQKLGYNFNSKSARRAFFAKHLGQAGSDFVERGVSGLAGVPIDISGRMGLGNLIPGTGLLTKKTDHTSDVAELAGPAGDLAKRAFQAGSKAMDGDLIGKDGAVTTLAPLAVRNLSQAADMAKHGMYRDARGRKVVETDQLDALSKAFGFQPNDVKRVQDATREVQQMISLNKIRETEIADQWAKAMFERDKDGVQEARDALKRWNADNPESPIRISMQQINKRLANMRMSKEDRMAKTASKEIRATVRRELEAAR